MSQSENPFYQANCLIPSKIYFRIMKIIIIICNKGHTVIKVLKWHSLGLSQSENLEAATFNSHLRGKRETERESLATMLKASLPLLLVIGGYVFMYFSNT